MSEGHAENRRCSGKGVYQKLKMPVGHRRSYSFTLMTSSLEITLGAREDNPAGLTIVAA